ncbi:MAG: rhomboid family intramembrane serine protease [Chitinophagaceae bacterium]|nr:MAG: rhomboid family intramembrane serine protease [Chitinophagaceae bacterium]
MESILPFIATYVLIGATVLVSMLAFGNEQIMDDLIFYPPAIGRGQWYRFFSNGFIHADYFHLVFNMYALYGFGRIIELALSQLFPGYGRILYALMYFAALLVCLLPTFFKHRHNYHYRSLGASGAVSAVLFACIMLMPGEGISIFFLPEIPGYVFGPIYLLISSFMDRRGGDNINHSAHLWGALFGIAFIIVACQVAGYPVITNFVNQVQHSLR